jgi:hypothetical protein
LNVKPLGKDPKLAAAISVSNDESLEARVRNPVTARPEFATHPSTLLKRVLVMLWRELSNT